MMKQLPSDVLSEIFLLLDESDRMECMNVCHYWRKVLEDTALYQTVTLPTIDSLLELLAKIQDKPDIAKKIQQLSILFRNGVVHQNKINQFLILLPNVRVLFCTLTPYIFNSSHVVPDYSWYESIEYFEDRSGTNSIFLHTLSANMCPKLTTLFIYPGRNNELIPLLKNAPALKHLTLEYGTVTLSDLDALHENTSSLKSLTLIGAELEDSAISDNLSPAVSISRFSVDCLYVRFITQGTNLLVYISKKYPNLSELNFDVDYNRVELDDYQIAYISANGWNHVFRNMGSQLNTLNLGTDAGISNLFEKLDGSKLQISHLRVVLSQSITLNHLIRSQQIHYIHTLTLVDMDFIQTFRWLNKLTVLKKLKLCGHLKKTINMSYILANSSPTLKSLEIENYDLNFDLEYNNESYVESLSLIGVTYPEKMDSFINQHLPNLLQLNLRRCKSVKITWDLPTLNLSFFQFTPISLTKPYSFLVKTYSDNESRLYSVRNPGINIILSEGHPLNYQSYRTKLINETDIVSCFTLYCNSLKMFSS